MTARTRSTPGYRHHSNYWTSLLLVLLVSAFGAVALSAETQNPDRPGRATDEPCPFQLQLQPGEKG